MAFMQILMADGFTKGYLKVEVIGLIFIWPTATQKRHLSRVDKEEQRRVALTLTKSPPCIMKSLITLHTDINFCHQEKLSHLADSCLQKRTHFLEKDEKLQLYVVISLVLNSVKMKESLWVYLMCTAHP